MPLSWTGSSVSFCSLHDGITIIITARKPVIVAKKKSFRGVFIS
jgi:hypothetical protein